MAPRTVSATTAKLQFGNLMAAVKGGAPIVIEKNDTPQIVWISVDDYEDFLESKDMPFQRTITKAAKEIKKGRFGTLSKLHEIHKKTIQREAN